jgi:hypothetical protein
MAHYHSGQVVHDLDVGLAAAGHTRVQFLLSHAQTHLALLPGLLVDDADSGLSGTVDEGD